MKKYISIIISSTLIFFIVGCAVAPKPLTGIKLQQVQESFVFDDSNGEEDVVAGDIRLKIGDAIANVTDYEVYYGTSVEDNTLAGGIAAKGFEEGVVATLENTDFTGEEKLFLFLKNSAVSSNNTVFSGVSLSIIDNVEEEEVVVEEAEMEAEMEVEMEAEMEAEMEVEEEEVVVEEDPNIDYPGGVILDNLYFDFNKFNLKETAIGILAEFIDSVDDLYSVQVVVTGHADERGSNEYNLALGEKRAIAVKEYLITNSIPGSNIRVLSFGEERPLCVDSDEYCWQQNRRVETSTSQQR